MFNNSAVLTTIAKYFDEKSFDVTDEKRNFCLKFLDELEHGDIRCTKFEAETWHIDERVKKAILFCFKQGINKELEVGPFTFIDKDNLFPKKILSTKNIRIVPGGVSIRRGAFLGNNCVFMPPSFVNIGAYIDEGSMLDSNALVGSCAFVGKGVHISAGVQIGGVLEPIGALPVIIEDEVLLGANSGVFEGTIVKKRAVIAAGVNLTKGVKIFDVVNDTIIQASDGVLQVPTGAVVVMGSRKLPTDFAQKNDLSISCPIIIKYRDEKTDGKTALEDALR